MCENIVYRSRHERLNLGLPQLYLYRIYLFIIYFYVQFVCKMHVCVWAHRSWWMSRGQRITLWSLVFSFHLYLACRDPTQVTKFGQQRSLLLVLFYFIFFWDRDYSLWSPGWPGADYDDQAGTELTETLLPLPPVCWPTTQTLFLKTDLPLNLEDHWLARLAGQ